MYLNRCLLLAFLLVITLKMIHKTRSINPMGNSCSNATMFVNGSTYQTNLNTLLTIFISNSSNNPSGYLQTIVGNPKTEAVYGHYLCRGDVSTEICLRCVKISITTGLSIFCPNRKNAVIWYHKCMVRYSNVSFFKKMDHSFPSYDLRNSMIENSTRFMEILGNMLNNVIAVQASQDGPLKKFATHIANYTSSESIYGLGQCTPDLSVSDCHQCLMLSIRMFKQRTGGQIYAPSCNVRYEIYPFYNLSYLSALPSPSPSTSLSMPSYSNHTSASSGNKKLSTKVLVSIIVAALLVFSVALCLICICLLKNKARKVDVSTHVKTLNQDFTADSLQYDFATLLNATNNFSDENKLGEGGFGGVYKGTLSNGKLIAVKRLSASSSQGLQEFETEVLVVANLQHRNLVRLLGFCYTEQEKLLVYEYVPNKSLDNFIYDQEKRQQFDWGRRYNIIRGIARGLLYLHHDSQLRIIHRDLKPSNILLDEQMNPKISDFGTSRIFGADHSQSNYTNKVVGTYGYMAPEYALQGQFSIKSDAYSFGVLVLEIISGRKANSFNQATDVEDLLSYAWRQWEAGTPLEFVDPIIRDSSSNMTDVKRCIQIGLLCVQESVEDRPTMANVVLTLDSYSTTLPVPERSDFLARPRLITSLLPKEVKNSGNSSSKSLPLSVNEDSITELEPR